ncbi:MAG TPA: FtsX-like permease family protein [Oligoflexia bacterium]|nr:FtsX-like permease family protein [Oligoflexia bacterium]HMP27222.1 FtsX-like permease family protein [Oligoflexia bacterium]
MYRIAIKMLVGNGSKYLAMIIGVVFASLVITQQLSIFCGLMSRTFGFLSDTPEPDLWVMEPKVQFVDDIKPMAISRLWQVKGIDGVEWAVPLYKGIVRVRLEGGTFQNSNLIGIDDATLIGGPARMLNGTLADLRRADGIIVDQAGASKKLARLATESGRSVLIPASIGDQLEINDQRGVIVGVARVTRTFQSQPVIYTTFSRATRYAPAERKQLSFILVGLQAGADKTLIKKQIAEKLGLAAYTTDEFKDLSLLYFLRNTGIPINFGIAVLLAFLVGVAIVGQSFYSFTLDNLRYFGTLRAMGASNFLLLQMMALQAAVVGSVGFGIGSGIGSLFYYVSRNSELAFRMPWQVPFIAASAVVIISLLAALLSLRKIATLEPAMVFRF